MCQSEKNSFQMILPTQRAIHSPDPNMMSHHPRTPDQQKRPDPAKTDVVMKENITPSGSLKHLPRPGLPQNFIGTILRIQARGTCKDANLMPQPGKFIRQNLGNCLQASNTWRKHMRTKQNFQIPGNLE
jgi:hypothetical protein